eukprot:CAMPEP_0184131602 /NCGR_PEP_ID=MMETSP0974-20121125/28199_1 /TAXON_ID=483370 /ORGANISM="non described non described, Strain CCMP2097" /LENGTH=54 /DNA_ID=CAMNT_0026435099 /DNA_START=9 /DNA_END=170 /DNA_ORIENTATION=-
MADTRDPEPFINSRPTFIMQFAAVIIALAASAQAFAPSAPMKVSTVVRNTPGEK